MALSHGQVLSPCRYSSHCTNIQNNNISGNPNVGHCLPFHFRCPSLLHRVPSPSRGVGGLLFSSLREGSGLPSGGNWVLGIVQGERKVHFQEDWVSLQKPARGIYIQFTQGATREMPLQLCNTILLSKYKNDSTGN